MTENSNQPKEYDVVLGGRSSVPVDSMVLGGLERVKQVLAIEGVELQIDALLDALQYGQSGLDLVIQALESKSEEVQEAAYWLLQDSIEPRVKLALQAYNPYLFFECLSTLQMGSAISLALSPDRKTLVNVDDDNGTIKVWNLQTQGVIHTFEFSKRSGRIFVAITPDGKILVISNCSQDYIEVWELQTERKISTTPQSGDSFFVNAISLDGQLFVNVGNCDDTDYIDYTLWNVWTGKAIFGIEMHGSYRNIRVIGTNEQTLITTFSDKNIILWDWETGQLIRTLTGHSGYIKSAVISSDKLFLVSGSVDKTITVWNFRTGQELCTLTGHSFPIISLILSLDGQLLVSSSSDGTVKVWGLP